MHRGGPKKNLLAIIVDWPEGFITLVILALGKVALPTATPQAHTRSLTEGQHETHEAADASGDQVPCSSSNERSVSDYAPSVEMRPSVQGV